MPVTDRLWGRRVLIAGEDGRLADRLGAVFLSFGAVLEVLSAETADGTGIARLAAKELGRIDVLVNTGLPTAPEEGAQPLAIGRDVERALARSMTLLVTTTEAALLAMHAGASIINSVAYSSPGLVLTRGQEALATAVLETTQGWAQSLAPRHIRVNAIVGGPRWDPLMEGRVDGNGRRKRPNDAEELDAFVYLASRSSYHVSGSVLAVARALTRREVEPFTER
ncbi:SDR family oxidoreductase [Sinomonas sp. JGH33]|uniref:SDR family oxidoreductase n=1 Tax=Sinomonas terricola TaxID=3110330 RepID=A0ABU5T9T0_9MICC|nr:SDR family oxidoreductase [Sinomonas sp. JGH33]MEA5456433.1 SDR family oxidoreductase [Sinomonas sp. JGH33]